MPIKNKEHSIVDITMGYKCNQNCLFCSVGHIKKDLIKSTDQIKHDILLAKKKQATVLGFGGGGEPTLRKDIVELVQFAKKVGFPVIRFQTNGVMFSYDNFMEKIIEAGANYFKFSIHGHNAKIHDALTQVKGSFERALKGINNLKKRGYSVEADIVINKLNYKYLPRFVEFFISKGISKFCFVYLIYEGNAVSNQEKVAVSMREVVPYLTDALELTEMFSLDKSLVFNIPYCLIKKHENKIVDLGEYNTIMLSPLNNQDLDKNRYKGKRKFNICAECKYDKLCHGVW
ncbi:MAG: radical SAM protein, partial [Candidatus Margulisbacteria bacterium]|nr:radical SAM protein [Candidatus Margulisiibacteriota bacterium]